MMSNQAAVKLIIENIQLLEQATTLIDGELSEAIFGSIDELIKESVESFNGEWEGIFNFYQESIHFAPKQWQANQADEFKYQNYYARYWLAQETDETNESGNYWWLSNLFKNDKDKMIFRFYPWYASFAKLGAKAWKEFARECNQNIPEIEQAGFKFNAKEGGWYLSISSLDPNLVINNYENHNLRDALGPIVEALEKLKQVHPYFDKIVQQAIEKFSKAEAE